MMSYNLSINSELMLEEPLFIASVITFGIEGDCFLEELMVNASIDDIYGNTQGEHDAHMTLILHICTE